MLRQGVQGGGGVDLHLCCAHALCARADSATAEQTAQHAVPVPRSAKCCIGAACLPGGSRRCCVSAPGALVWDVDIQRVA